MKKITLVLLVFISSCSPYFDLAKNQGIADDEWVKFKFGENSNTLTVVDRIPSAAHGQTFHHQKFEIKLPKKLKQWWFEGENYLIECSDGQIIGVNPGYAEENKKPKEWYLKDPIVSDEIFYAEIFSYVSSYDLSKKKLEYVDEIKLKKGRISKIYSNGEVDILLYNVKSKNFEHYLELIKSFRYID